MRSRDEIKAHLKTGISNATLGRRPSHTIGDCEVLATDLGLDSLDYATTLLEAERWLGIRIRDDAADWNAMRTVEELSGLLYGRQSR